MQALQQDQDSLCQFVNGGNVPLMKAQRSESWFETEMLAWSPVTSGLSGVPCLEGIVSRCCADLPWKRASGLMCTELKGFGQGRNHMHSCQNSRWMFRCQLDSRFSVGMVRCFCDFVKKKKRLDSQTREMKVFQSTCRLLQEVADLWGCREVARFCGIPHCLDSRLGSEDRRDKLKIWKSYERLFHRLTFITSNMSITLRIHYVFHPVN